MSFEVLKDLQFQGIFLPNGHQSIGADCIQIYPISHFVISFRVRSETPRVHDSINIHFDSDDQGLKFKLKENESYIEATEYTNGLSRSEFPYIFNHFWLRNPLQRISLIFEGEENSDLKACFFFYENMIHMGIEQYSSNFNYLEISILNPALKDDFEAFLENFDNPIVKEINL